MKKLIPLSLIVVVVIGLWIGCLLFVTSMFDTWQDRGLFGDLFGSVNALFSGLAFAGLIYAILLQHRELELQRQELKLQREEMAKSREELAKQAEIQKAQFYAAVAQVRVAAKQAEVEAIKIEAEKRSPDARLPQIKAVKTISEQLSVQADDLEGKLQ